MAAAEGVVTVDCTALIVLEVHVQVGEVQDPYHTGSGLMGRVESLTLKFLVSSHSSEHLSEHKDEG